jgi:hypothetical protein
MTKKYPNTSVLTLITQIDGENEKVLFIYLKPVPDFYPLDTIHWYDGFGKDGKTTTVWDNLRIKQWTACSKDDDIIKLFDEILSTKKLVIGKKEIKLNIPSYKVIKHSDEPFKNRRETIYDTLTTENNPIIPQEFYQKENLKFLSGYRSESKEIKPLFPLGFFEDNFIYDNLKSNVWGIKEYRTAYLTFHGVREKSQKGIGSNEMVGFYQQNFNPTSEYIAVVKNETDNEIGKAIIEKNSGFFKIELSEPTSKGKVEIIVNNKEEKAFEYVFIQDIQVNIQFANKTYNDIYGRQFLITSKEKKSEYFSNFTWQQSVYSDEKTANQKLSDLFKNIFEYLGSRIVVTDPYFLGNVNIDSVTSQLQLSNCQVAFINALIHSAIEKNIEQLYILGYWARAKIQVEKDDTQNAIKLDQLFGNYEKLFKGFIKTNKLQDYFNPLSIQFLNAKEDFHNRYWFSLKNENGIDILDKCVIVTNSLGGISKTEVDFVNVEEKSQLEQIIRKRTELYKNSENKLII